jgi:hypothetical protein
MQLIYRGVTYDYEPNKSAIRQRVHTFKSPYELMYRGNTDRVDPTTIAKTAVQPATYTLNYRGATYRINRNPQGQVMAIVAIPKPFKKSDSKPC